MARTLSNTLVVPTCFMRHNLYVPTDNKPPSGNKYKIQLFCVRISVTSSTDFEKAEPHSPHITPVITPSNSHKVYFFTIFTLCPLSNFFNNNNCKVKNQTYYNGNNQVKNYGQRKGKHHYHDIGKIFCFYYFYKASPLTHIISDNE